MAEEGGCVSNTEWLAADAAPLQATAAIDEDSLVGAEERHAADRRRRDMAALARALAEPVPDLAGPVSEDGGGEDVDRIASFAGFATYAEPVDCGTTTLSALGDIEYVTDLIRPGRIHVVAAEEGTGKTYGMTELGMRMSVAGGEFAGTWPIVVTGPVVYLSEMHPDDDWAYQQTVLDSLGFHRSALTGSYYRLDLNMAADGAPVLTDESWRDWFARWTRKRGVRLAVFDTATGATQVDPWGRDIQQVFRGIRGMLAEHPELAIVLVLHLKKPQGRGERRISDVLGEWARWCDVLILMERDGDERTKVSTMKRLRRQRRIVATRSGGLLLEPEDLTDRRPTKKVSVDRQLQDIEAYPGKSYAELAELWGVSKPTAASYVKALGDTVATTPEGPRGAITVSIDRQTAKGRQTRAFGGGLAVTGTEVVGDHQTTKPPYIDKAVGLAVPAPSPRIDDVPVEEDYPRSAWEIDD